MAMQSHAAYFVVGAGINDLSTAWRATQRFTERAETVASRVVGIGYFTADCFPVFDHFHENATVIVNSNHGVKMPGVDHFVADKARGQTLELLEPFRFDRFEKSERHSVPNSQYTWN